MILIAFGEASHVQAGSGDSTVVARRGATPLERARAASESGSDDEQEDTKKDFAVSDSSDEEGASGNNGAESSGDESNDGKGVHLGDIAAGQKPDDVLICLECGAQSSEVYVRSLVTAVTFARVSV